MYIDYNYRNILYSNLVFSFENYVYLFYSV